MNSKKCGHHALRRLAHAAPSVNRSPERAEGGAKHNKSMLGWLIEWYFNRVDAKQRAELPAIDWQSLLKRVDKHIHGRASIFLETRDERFVFVESEETNSEGLEFLSLIVTWSREGLKPWETEEPARNLVQKLADREDLNAVLLLSRSLDSFVGYYVRIRPVLAAKIAEANSWG